MKKKLGNAPRGQIGDLLQNTLAQSHLCRAAPNDSNLSRSRDPTEPYRGISFGTARKDDVGRLEFSGADSGARRPGRVTHSLGCTCRGPAPAHGSETKTGLLRLHAGTRDLLGWYAEALPCGERVGVMVEGWLAWCPGVRR